jgi:hypothetical protein
MNMVWRVTVGALVSVLCGATGAGATVEDRNGEFWYEGRQVNHRGHAEGLLINIRAVQAAVRDYGNAIPFDYEENVDRVVAAMPEWRERGLNMLTVGMQGGSPSFGCTSASAPRRRDLSMFDANGNLRFDAKERLERVIRAAEDNDLIVNVQVFYLNDQTVNAGSIINALTQATQFLEGLNTDNVLIEIANEVSANNAQESPALMPDQIDDRVRQVHSIWPEALVTTSFSSGYGPTDAQREMDWISLHLNNKSVADSRTIIRRVKADPDTLGKPIAVTEDFLENGEPFQAAIDEGAGWGFYEMGCDGYQHMWGGIDWSWDATAQSTAFFDMADDMSHR